MLPRCRVVVCLLVFCTAALGWDRASKPWDELTDCRLLAHYGNDGDSFHVEHKGKEYIFRLCFVDCAETSDSYEDRVKAQAKWWGIEVKDVLRYGAEATAFTRDLLKGTFTVFTRYEDARGKSSMKRNFAMIRVGDRYLCEHLVTAGLARTYGYPVVTPTGQAAKSFRSHLDDLEKRAKKARKGAWATNDLKGAGDSEDAGSGAQYTLTRQVAAYADTPAATFMGNLKAGALIFVPGQAAGPMVKLRGPLHGRVVSVQCRRRELTGGIKKQISD